MMTSLKETHATKSGSLSLPIKGVRKEVINHFNVQYSFGEFILKTSRVLYHKNQQINISPKELGVLVMLLESDGEVVTKDQIIHEVWSGGNVGEESLTRCIYVLRRILQENKDQRFIDTVYGKGYRFALPVTRMKPNERQSAAECIFAVLPFKLSSPVDALGLHDAIVQELSEYAATGLFVLPASLTLNCSSVPATLDVLEKFRPDCYLTGHELVLADKPSLRVELIRAHDHVVLHRESISLDNSQTIDSLKGSLKPFFLNHLIDARNHKAPLEAPAAESCPQQLLQEGREALLRYSPDDLARALLLFRQCQRQLPDDPTLLGHLAECHFALGQMGLHESKSALQECGQLVDRLLTQAPQHPLALALCGVLHGLRHEFGPAAEMFRRALMLSPNSAQVKYYYAWHLFIVGEIKRARHFARQAQQMLPAMNAIQILSMWLAYCDDHDADALQLLNRQPDAMLTHPVLLNMKTVMLNSGRRPGHAGELLDLLSQKSGRKGGVCFNGFSDVSLTPPANAYGALAPI